MFGGSEGGVQLISARMRSLRRGPDRGGRPTARGRTRRSPGSSQVRTRAHPRCHRGLLSSRAMPSRALLRLRRRAGCDDCVHAIARRAPRFRRRTSPVGRVAARRRRQARGCSTRTWVKAAVPTPVAFVAAPYTGSRSLPRGGEGRIRGPRRSLDDARADRNGVARLKGLPRRTGADHQRWAAVGEEPSRGGCVAGILALGDAEMAQVAPGRPGSFGHVSSRGLRDVDVDAGLRALVPQ